jgi:phage-related protein
MVGMEGNKLAPLLWIASSKRDFMRMPERVITDIGYALYRAQLGEHPNTAKPLRGFGGAAVIELSEDCNGDTFRAVYTTRFGDVLVVLHAFQKKSTRGIETSKQDIELIRSRITLAEEIYKTWKSLGANSNG